MTRLGAAMAVVVLVGIETTPARQQTPTFRSATDAVSVEVSVRDRARTITGLRPEDFDVRDNGVAQQVVNVSYDTLPIDVTVVLDVSFSVAGSLLDRLSHAVRQLMLDLRPADRLKLMTFNTRVSRVVNFTTDTADVDRAIRTSVAGGGSSIWDALGVAVTSASEPGRRQLVMIFTDGSDSSSVTTPTLLTRLTERTNVAISAVVPSSGFLFRAVAGDGPSLLQQLTRVTGGQYVPVFSARQDLTETFQRTLSEFRSAYVLHFVPTGVEAGGFHALTVSVRGKDRYTVQARRGYFR